MKLKEIETKDILINPFSMIEDDWFLITSAINGKVNTFLSEVNDDESQWKSGEFTKLIRQIFTEFDPAWTAGCK